MIGTKKYAEIKAQKLAADKERRRYFAIRDYYGKKASQSSANGAASKRKPK